MTFDFSLVLVQVKRANGKQVEIVTLHVYAVVTYSELSLSLSLQLSSPPAIQDLLYTLSSAPATSSVSAVWSLVPSPPLALYC